MVSEEGDISGSEALVSGPQAGARRPKYCGRIFGFEFMAHFAPLEPGLIQHRTIHSDERRAARKARDLIVDESSCVQDMRHNPV